MEPIDYAMIAISAVFIAGIWAWAFGSSGR